MQGHHLHKLCSTSVPDATHQVSRNLLHMEQFVLIFAVLENLFYLAHGLSRLIRNTKSGVSCLQMSHAP